MDLATYISFGDELSKIALDAETLSNLADRYQKEYLEGGKLPSNAPDEVYSNPKLAMTGSNTFSPARALSQTRAVGSFQDKVVHKGDRIRPPTMGQNFKIPSIPGE
jgi:hypothetical protein